MAKSAKDSDEITVPAGKVAKALKDKRKKWRENYYAKKNKNGDIYNHLAKLIVAVAKEI